MVRGPRPAAPTAEAARNVERVTLELESLEIANGGRATDSPMSGRPLASLRHSAAMRAGFIAHWTILQNRLSSLEDIRGALDSVRRLLAREEAGEVS